MNQELKTKLEKLAQRECWCDKEYFVVNYCAGGNVDDAYWSGSRDGETALARTLLKNINTKAANPHTDGQRRTTEQVALEFKKDLQDLLDRYGATIEVGIDWCGNEHIEVTVPAIYDISNNLIQEWTHIDLGTFVEATEDSQL